MQRMKLVDLSDFMGTPTFVNPYHVVSVELDVWGTTVISMTNNSWLKVEGDHVKAIVEQLLYTSC